MSPDNYQHSDNDDRNTAKIAVVARIGQFHSEA